MAKEKDPAEIIETIAESIKVSQRHVRRVRAHRFKELFGYQALTGPAPGGNRAADGKGWHRGAAVP